MNVINYRDKENILIRIIVDFLIQERCNVDVMTSFSIFI